MTTPSVTPSVTREGRLSWINDIAKSGKYDYRILRHKTRVARNEWDTQWLVIFTGGTNKVDIGKPGIGHQEIGRVWSKSEAREIAQQHHESQP